MSFGERIFLALMLPVVAVAAMPTAMVVLVGLGYMDSARAVGMLFFTIISFGQIN